MRSVVVIDFNKKENETWKELCSVHSLSCKEGHEGDKTKYALVRKSKVGGWK